MARSRSPRRATASAEPATQVAPTDRAEAAAEAAPALEAVQAAPASEAEAPAAAMVVPPGEDSVADVIPMAAPSANGAPAPRGPGRNHRRRRRRRQQGPIPFRPRPAHPADGEDQLDLGPAEDPSAPLTPVAAAARRIGIRRLHPEQQRAIEAALAGRNVLMVLPTGFGKSAAYQIPSMLLPKPVVLISPLLA